MPDSDNAAARPRVLTPTITDPDAQETVAFLGEVHHLRLTGEDTGGEFALVETQGRRGHASPMHVHRHASETFVLLDGVMRILVGEAQHDLVAGSAAVLPPSLPHGFVVTSDSARYLTLHHGPGFEEFLRDAGRTPGDAADDLNAVAARHGIDIIGPPPVA